MFAFLHLYQHSPPPDPYSRLLWSLFEVVPTETITILHSSRATITTTWTFSHHSDVLIFFLNRGDKYK
ncbi:hypothetical protein A0H81_04320 [Grifola frondosa]|uniref:Uncharacterized protein n=1 Tax=Grifola frondosa TaxID=5627 RepID=A0A1C7MFU4_GRIFR|nr:hypothetical protein A0H81_04320 [Grifola frondosa]